MAQPGRKALTPEQVRDARRWYAQWSALESLKAKARAAGIDPSRYWLAAKGATYKDVR